MKEKINFRKIVIFLLFTFILFQDSFEITTNLYIITYFDEIFIVVYFIVSIIKTNGVINKKVLKLFFWILFFLIIGIIGCIYYSNYQLKTLLVSSFLMIKFFICLMAVMIYPPNEQIKKDIICSIKILGYISIFSGLINLILPKIWLKLIPYTYTYYRDGLNSIMGLFIHAGQYGWFMMFTALIYLSEYEVTKSTKKNIGFFVFAIFALLSLKVKVIITFIFISLLKLFKIEKRKINFKKVIILILVIGVLILSNKLIVSTYNQYFTDNNKNTSARYALLKGSISIMKDYFPLGVGFSKYGTFYAAENYSEYYYKYNCDIVWGLMPNAIFFGTDTFWPAIFGETGFLGTVIYVIILFMIFKWLDINLKLKNNFYSFWGFFVFVQAIIESSGEPIFNSSPQNILIAICLGIALSQKNENDEVKK